MFTDRLNTMTSLMDTTPLLSKIPKEILDTDATIGMSVPTSVRYLSLWMYSSANCL